MATFIRFPTAGNSFALINADAIAYATPGEANGTRIVLQTTEPSDTIDVTTPFATVASMLNAQDPPAP